MIPRHLTKLKEAANAAEQTVRTVVAPSLLALWKESPNNHPPSHQPFDKIPQRAPAVSNRVLTDYVNNHPPQDVLDQFLEARRSGRAIDDSTLSSLLKACGSLCDCVLGSQLHCLCTKYGHANAVGVGTSLVDMYMKCDSIEDGRSVFEWMPERNVVSWTSLLTGYADGGLHETAMKLFFRMQKEAVRPNPFTFVTFLASAACQGALKHGMGVHGLAIKFGHNSTIFVCNSLINMYSKCGSVEDAEAIFMGMQNRDSISWNAMIAGLVLNGLDLEALQMFYKSRVSALKPTQSSYATAIKLCANLKQLALAQQLHCCALKDGFESVDNITTALMVMYNKCGKLDEAFEIFSSMPASRNVVSWTAMIGGYIKHGNIAQAAFLFSEMRKGNVEPNDFTYSTLLTASPTISHLQIHAQVIKTEYQDVPSVGTALLAAYTSLGSTHQAFAIFKEIEGKDIITWSAMLACYAQAGDSEGAVMLFTEMTRQGLKPNEYTLSSAVDASASPAAASDQGKQFHAFSIKCRYQDAICVSSALVTMYARKGSIESAQGVFERQSTRDLVSWNSIISGYAQHGYGKKALEIFRQMEAQGVEMDGITFIGVIMGCTHAGLIEEGRTYFDLMVNNHRISPTMEHCACMVDLYSRAGRLEEALKFIGDMPFPAGSTVWRTLLGACRVHRNIELGKLAAEKLMLLEPLDSAAYVLLSNIFAVAGKWEERAKVRKMMDSRRVKKEAGCSWIQVKNKVHSFIASDRSHPWADKIYAKLQEMTDRLKAQGYQPNTDFVLHDMEEEQKVAMLSRHSERLALAFGLIATPERTPLQIIKNLRVCGDCHTVIKLVSALEVREIVVRDSNRFHHFAGGSCSCGDYW